MYSRQNVLQPPLQAPTLQHGIRPNSKPDFQFGSTLTLRLPYQEAFLYRLHTVTSAQNSQPPGAYWRHIRVTSWLRNQTSSALAAPYTPLTSRSALLQKLTHTRAQPDTGGYRNKIERVQKRSVLTSPDSAKPSASSASRNGTSLDKS